MNLTDGYKVGHIHQYPKKLEEVYSNFTPRGSRDPRIKAVVAFGLQAFVQKRLIDEFNQSFFTVEKDLAVANYKRRIDTYLGPGTDVSHIAKLHDLGYLPLEIRAVPEGTLVPFKVPMMTIRNTISGFGWLVNYLETLISCENWHPCTSATIAFEYRKLLTRAAHETNPEMLGFVQWQGHDFSMRGQSSLESAITSGAAHLLSFTGTDTVPAIDYLEQYYDADSEKELIGGSVGASEHSVASTNILYNNSVDKRQGEIDFLKRYITEVYPTGIASYVADTYDFWQVITDIVPSLKDVIMSREGKLVVRPDTGDPFKVICGDLTAPKGTAEYKGAIECLWDTFGGTTTSKGFKQLDSHIGLIYGDSITLELAERICNGLKEKGFASTNVVLGIGSFTYQYVTRDTFGFAMKATHAIVDGQNVVVYKEPKGTDGFKKSARGYLKVNDDLTLTENVTYNESLGGILRPVFMNGVTMNVETLSTIRERLLKNL